MVFGQKHTPKTIDYRFISQRFWEPLLLIFGTSGTNYLRWFFVLIFESKILAKNVRLLPYFATV
jgi:hypothetical protein